MIGVSELEELKNFFAGYFHEDWPEEAEDAAGVLELYMSQNVDEAAHHRLAKGIQAFIACHTDDAELERALFSELGCYYMPSTEHQSTREWLEQIAAKLSLA